MGLIVYHYLCAFIIPIVGSLITYWRTFGTHINRVDGSTEQNLVKAENKSILLQELPICIFNNIVWAFCFTLTGKKELFWIITEIFEFFFCFGLFILLDNKNCPESLKIKWYRSITIITIILVPLRIHSDYIFNLIKHFHKLFR